MSPYNGSMDSSPFGIRKLIIGILALGSLLTAAGMFLFAPDGMGNPVTAVTMRLGIMLGALWLALPSNGENVGWEKAMPAILAVIVVLAFFARNLRILAFAVPIAIVVGVVAAFIRPRSRRRPPRQ